MLKKINLIKNSLKKNKFGHKKKFKEKKIEINK